VLTLTSPEPDVNTGTFAILLRAPRTGQPVRVRVVAIGDSAQRPVRRLCLVSRARCPPTIDLDRKSFGQRSYCRLMQQRYRCDQEPCHSRLEDSRHTFARRCSGDISAGHPHGPRFGTVHAVLRRRVDLLR